MSAVVFCLICEKVMNISEYEHPSHSQKCKRDPQRRKYSTQYQFGLPFEDDE